MLFKNKILVNFSQHLSQLKMNNSFHKKTNLTNKKTPDEKSSGVKFSF